MILTCIYTKLRGLSRKFCSAENFGPGPIFSEKIVPPRTNFPEKRAGAENFVPVYTSLKIDCKKLYDARRGRSARNKAHNNCLILNPTIDSNNSIQCACVTTGL